MENMDRQTAIHELGHAVSFAAYTDAQRIAITIGEGGAQTLAVTRQKPDPALAIFGPAFEFTIGPDFEDTPITQKMAIGGLGVIELWEKYGAAETDREILAQADPARIQELGRHAMLIAHWQKPVWYSLADRIRADLPFNLHLHNIRRFLARAALLRTMSGEIMDPLWRDPHEAEKMIADAMRVPTGELAA